MSTHLLNGAEVVYESTFASSLTQCIDSCLYQVNLGYEDGREAHGKTYAEAGQVCNDARQHLKQYLSNLQSF